MSFKRTSFFGTVVDQEEEDIDFESDNEEDEIIDHPLYGEKTFKRQNFFNSKFESNICFGQNWEVEGEEVLKKYEGINIIQEVKEKSFFEKLKKVNKKWKKKKKIFKFWKTQFSLPLSKIYQIDEKFTKEVNKITHTGFRIISKDYFYFDFLFLIGSENLSNVVETIKSLIYIKEITKTFSYEFKRYNSIFTPSEIANGWNIYKIKVEFERQKISMKKWKFSNLNENFEICSSYPRCFVVPNIKDEIIINSSKYRSKGRLPVLSWSHPIHETPLVRCSQPNAGLGFNRSKDDEFLIESCRKINEDSKMIVIIDCRPKYAEQQIF